MTARFLLGNWDVLQCCQDLHSCPDSIRSLLGVRAGGRRILTACIQIMLVLENVWGRIGGTYQPATNISISKA